MVGGGLSGGKAGWSHKKEGAKEGQVRTEEKMGEAERPVSGTHPVVLTISFQTPGRSLHIHLYKLI